MAKCLQYGSGLVAPEEWINYDVSPMIRIRRIPILGRAVEKRRGVYFPKNVLYGDIVKGLPKHNSSCNAVYCSHVLEHLTYDEFKIAIQNTYSLLVPGGIFRLVMPDLRSLCENYISYCKTYGSGGSDLFMKKSNLGMKEVRNRMGKRLQATLGNSRHHWLWDYETVVPLLYEVGFKSVRRCVAGDSVLKQFELVENPGYFENAVAIEAIR